jgi:hypothetical protein
METCKHDWHFIEGTERLRCRRCHTETGGVDWSKLTIPTEQMQGYKLHDSRPNSIRFYSPGDTSTEVLRISKDGIWANPDVPCDEAAKKVLEAIDGYVKTMIERVREAGRQEALAAQEPVAYLCENAAGHRYFRWKKPSGMYKPVPLYTKEKTNDKK